MAAGWCVTCGESIGHRDRCGTGSEFTLQYDGRPWTHNAERRGNRYQRAANVKEFREAFAWLAREQRIPLLAWLTVTAVPHQRRGPLQDVSACHPAVKAAIDGIVDAGVITDDTPEFVPVITYLPPQRGTDRLTIIITGPEGA